MACVAMTCCSHICLTLQSDRKELSGCAQTAHSRSSRSQANDECSEVLGPFFRSVLKSNERVTWYVSKGMRAISPPGPCKNLDIGVLYIHQYGSYDKQIWVWSEYGWSPIREGNAHPRLEGYVFSMKNMNEPSWATREFSA
jgi:hypothetical protein